MSEARVTLAWFFDNHANTSWKVLARDRFVSICILPNVDSKKQNRAVKQEISVYSRMTRLFPRKKRIRRQKCCSYCENCTTIGLCLARFGKKSWDQFNEYDSHGLRNVLRVSGKNKWLSHGKMQVKNPHQRSPYAMTFEDRSPEETERQQRCARSKAWNLAKNIFKLKEKNKTAFYSASEKRVMLVTWIKKPEEREFVVDSGASMHMVSKKDVDSAELETMRTSRSPTTLMTANGEVLTKGEATENVKELELFVTVMLLEETPAVLSLGKLCEDHGYTYHWTSGQKPRLTKKGKNIELCTICGSWFICEFSTTPSPTYPSSSSQDSVFGVNRYSESPVQERSRSTSEEIRWNPMHKPTENRKQQKMTRGSTKRSLAWLAELASGFQREFGQWK